MAPTLRLVGRYATQEKYSLDFFGEEFNVTVTSTCSVIRKWIGSVIYRHKRFTSGPLVVGVGVQWTQTPDSQSSDYSVDSSSASYDNSESVADTLQLCVGRRCLIIQLRHCEQIPNYLRKFLKNPRNKFVGVWNGQDARRLAQCKHELEIGELFDIRQYVTDSEGRTLRRSSFEEIVEKCLGYEGVRLDQKISKSDWSLYNLNDDQILQASVDVYVCQKLGIGVHLWRL